MNIKTQDTKAKNLEIQKQKRISDFYKVLDQSADLADNLGELTKFIHEFTGSTGVYIGKLEHPRKIVEDTDNDKAHVERDKDKVVKFIHAEPASHNYMKNKIL